MGAIKRRTVRIGTRKSRLALVQTNMVAEAIEAACPEVKWELVPLMTKGDKILKTSLVAFGGKGAFVEEFEQSILNGDIDLAVHSAKDMPMDLSDGLCIGAVLKREDPRDVFVTVKGRTPERSPRIIGTGSPRRQVQIMEHGDVECRLLRGNVDTRLEKLYQGEYDGIILAAAGLNRLGLFNDPRFSFEFLEPEMFLPAGGQGIIAVEAKKGSEVLKILKKLNDKEAERALFAERKVLYRSGRRVREGREWNILDGTHAGDKKWTYPQEDLRSAGGFHETRGASRKEGDRRGASGRESLSCGSRPRKRRTYHGKRTADLKGCGGPCLRPSWLRGTADSGAGGL